jgi:hypothetical protein
MTLYDEPQLLLQRAADVVSRHADGQSLADTRGELADVARVLRRIASMWPAMFATLAKENRVLSDALETVRAAAAAAGCRGPAPLSDTNVSGASGVDPVVHYQETLLAMDAWVRYLHGIGQPWSVNALATIRRAIAASAEIQGVMVDRAFAAGSG